MLSEGGRKKAFNPDTAYSSYFLIIKDKDWQKFQAEATSSEMTFCIYSCLSYKQKENKFQSCCSNFALQGFSRNKFKESEGIVSMK